MESSKVMLDAQGYLKLIDFGIAKKLPEGESKTFTMILSSYWHESDYKQPCQTPLLMDLEQC